MNNIKELKSRYDIIAIIIAIISVGLVSFFFLKYTEQGIAFAATLFTFITQTFGILISWYALGLVLVGVFFCFSKYGSIRLGDTKPEFSTFNYILMTACAGAGSGTIYWAFLEWGNYMIAPPFGLDPFSLAASDWSVTYTLFHNGITAWSIYCIVGIPIAYSLYIKKNNSLKLSDIMASVLPPKTGKIVGRIIDCGFPVAVISGLTVVIGLGIPVVSAVTALLFGIEDSLAIKLICIIGVTIIYTISSFFGISKGMQNISKFGTWFIFGLVFYILIMGPTKFILDEISTSLGMLAQNFIKMSTYMDPVGEGNFPQSSTSWFYAYWMIYSPMMCIFVPRISKGRTIRELVLYTIGGGFIGTVLIWGILGSFMMHTQNTGAVIITDYLSAGNGPAAIAQALALLPLSPIIMVIFIIATLFLLATTLDSSAFSMACNTQFKLDKDGGADRGLKIFWCISLIIIPIVFIMVKAPVASIQSSVFVFVLPILLIFSTLMVVLFKWIKEDYGTMTHEEIINKHKI